MCPIVALRVDGIPQLVGLIVEGVGREPDGGNYFDVSLSGGCASGTSQFPHPYNVLLVMQDKGVGCPALKSRHI
ncbi:unnamed protein product [Gadus morhua 'NCC']